MKKRYEPRFAKIYLGGASQPEEQPVEVLEENPVKNTVALRRHYGPSTMLSENSKRTRVTQDADFNIGGKRSPFPAPTEDCPFDIIAYIAREAYEKPFNKIATA